jgi:hypothetical protein
MEHLRLWREGDQRQDHILHTACRLLMAGANEPAKRMTDRYFKPRDFLELLERERRWCELLITAILTRRELNSLNIKLVADDTIGAVLETRAWWLRN